MTDAELCESGEHLDVDEAGYCLLCGEYVLPLDYPDDREG